MEKATFTLGGSDIEFGIADTLKFISKSERSNSLISPFQISFFQADVVKRVEVIKAASRILENPSDPHRRQKEIEKLNRDYFVWLEQRLCSKDTSCQVKNAGLCSGIIISFINGREADFPLRVMGVARFSTWFDTINKLTERGESALVLFGKSLGIYHANCFNIER